MVVVPGFKRIASRPVIEATEGSEEVKLQAPSDGEVGI